MSWEELGNRFSGLLAFGSDLCSLQLVQDILDYESASATLSKPGGADLSFGLATGHALCTWEEHPAMGTLIQRNFKEAWEKYIYLSFWANF